MPDKSIRVHLVEISSTLRATQKANIRNVDRTNLNLQVHWQKKSRPSSSEYTMLVAYKSSSMRFQTGNSSSPHLSYEFCANLHRKLVEPWREVLVATYTEENSR